MDGRLRKKGKIVVGRDLQLRNDILLLVHASPLGGHSGVSYRLQKVPSLLYWKGLKKGVWEFVRSCEICQRNKYDRPASLGLLQPLPIPIGIFSNNSMDFITGLLKS